MAENKGKFITGDDIDKRYTTSLIMLAKLLKTDIEDINGRISWFIENSDLEVTTSDNFSSFH
tara:strand:- start:525 stop:710 length:186 start_codon:yes stop_codon:yes gene_type:complete